MGLTNPQPRRQVAYGNYTGNDVDGRQITTGFKCAIVIILGNASTRAGVIVNPDDPANMTFAGGNWAGGTTLHATDGFVVYKTADVMNDVGLTYRYYAIQAT
jgi:hypothetical protein